MGQSTYPIHSFPPDQPVVLEPRRKLPYDQLSRSWKYLCAQFPPFGTRAEMRSNIDARLLVTRAQDAVVRDSEIEMLEFPSIEPPAYDGELVESLLETVRLVQGTGLRIREAQDEDSGASPVLVPALRQEPSREFTVKPLGYLVGCSFNECLAETALCVSTEKYAEDPTCPAHVVIRLSEWMAGE